MNTQIQQLCADAVALIKPDVIEGLRGTRHVGLCIVVLWKGELVYRESFGARYTRGDVGYQEIAEKKAALVREHQCSLADLMERRRDIEVHNGGFIDGNLIVAVAGAGHLGNAIYGRLVLRRLSETLPEIAALAA